MISIGTLLIGNHNDFEFAVSIVLMVVGAIYIILYLFVSDEFLLILLVSIKRRSMINQ